ncbi:MAG: FKBP-type peptidyl-prolyl cis-trans isomerase [Candidatus Cryptobacteroides sp.]
MKIAQHTVVELCYELEVEGQIVDRTTKEKPLDFIQGTGSLLKKFEENIEGLEPGGKFAFTLIPEEAYGMPDPNRIIDLPKEAFAINGEIREDLLVAGNIIPMLNGAGAVVPGKILEVSEASVKMDLNSPMAGKTLNFSGEILTVREATEKELTEGLHGEYIHSNCGCGGCGGHSHEGGCGGCGSHEGGCGSHEGGCGSHDGEGCCGGHSDDCGCGDKGCGNC